jgi:hypothetical protein
MNKSIVIEELRRVAQLLDTNMISRSVYQQHGTISSGAIEKTFGSWNEAILAAGLTPIPQGGQPRAEAHRMNRVLSPATAGSTPTRIPDDELLDDLLRLAKELGRRPSGNQVAAKGKYDSTVYQRRWGSIAAAYGRAISRKGA